MATSYPALFVDANGETRIAGTLTFTGAGPTFTGGTITPAAGGTGLGITPVSPNATASETDALVITVPQSAAPNFPNIYAIRLIDPDTAQVSLSVASDGTTVIAGQPFSIPLKVFAAAVNPDPRTFSVFDTTSDEALRVDKDGGTTVYQAVGFYGTAPAAQPAASDIAAALATLGLVAAGTRGATLDGGIKTTAITSGALPTVTCVSGTGRQVSTARDVQTHTPVTFNDSISNATCKVELSPDNSIYSTLYTLTLPNFVGAVTGNILPISVVVPAAWYIKLTTTNATLGATSYY